MYSMLRCTHNIQYIYTRVYVSSMCANKCLKLQERGVSAFERQLTLKVPVTAIDACDTLKQDNDSTVRGDGGGRVGEVRAGTTSPMPEHKGFKLQ